MPRLCRRHRVSLLVNVIFGTLLLISLCLLASQRIRFSVSPPGAAQDPHAVQEFFALSHEPNPLIDWHNYSLIRAETVRRGPGEHGLPVFLKPTEKTRSDRLYQVNGYNAFISDKISVRRSLRDIRHPSCKSRKYRRDLPTASIIVPFHQEHWSTLLRTFITSLLRAPQQLVKEVILVDDNSSKHFLKQPLELYLRSRYRNRVRVVRAESRQGLIRARILGAANATGDVLIFLDSHCEPNTNWLPPLLDPIAEDYRTVVCPLIDIVDYDTFEYRPQDEGARGAFDWELFYKRIPLQPDDIKHPSRPFESPVMAGGLFAISRKWFWELGGYDPGLDIWGGEQYELSFKIWQCGGKLVDAPCSRVGHVYRKFAPFPNNAKGDFVARNYRRVAEVWMDEYKEFIYKRRPHYRKVETGDLTEQLAVRERLQCKPFSWYMARVAFDLPKYYPPVEPPPAALGNLRWLQDTRFCLDTKFGGKGQSPILALCLEDNPGRRTGEQNLTMTFHRDVRITGRDNCLDSPQGTEVILFPCHNFKGNQWWKFDPKTRQLRHVVSNKCLTGEAGSWTVSLRPCDFSLIQQHWSWSKKQDDLLQQYLADDESE